MTTTKILLATNNAGKCAEFQALYASIAHLELITPQELNLRLDVDETGDSYLANATLKAQAFAKASGLLCLADDSGLEVDALDGAPGIYSARYSPLPRATDADRRRHLINQIGATPRPWTARFQCVLVFANPKEILQSFQGSCEGEILPQDQGNNGFGYDPCFLVAEEGKTMAELSDQRKNQISHRARAVQKSYLWLDSLN